MLSLAGFVMLNTSGPQVAYFFMPGRLWELATGALVALMRIHRPSLGHAVPPSVALLTALDIMAVLCLPMALSTAAPVMVVMLAALLLATLHPQTPCDRLLGHSVVVYLGRISYSLYLWHWGVLALSRWTIGIHGFTVPP